MYISFMVVYHLVPTSNHNRDILDEVTQKLFIILFLHQTTTQFVFRMRFHLLFIILFLHQTTTSPTFTRKRLCCLSSCSYIKPQRPFLVLLTILVVYHLVPTSNHNPSSSLRTSLLLFIILFLHQTTTYSYKSAGNQ